MVSSLEPWRTPSQVWIPSELLTGMVPSPDSILVLSWPRAFRFGCLSTAPESGPGFSPAASCGEKMRESPHGAVLMYRWKRMLSLKG